ncbi:hypothetical protein [Paeniglutamicibacter cryotolerans]|uniref:Uncharacterized protein n=1 Tax=Paeniglutamicibacter cryotolerans TaxID=670079 RepID=A0A839QXH9_9MICC|nr:hypothetical protein [Paeniglutamicibacter cryotolerans]MBB2996681.1 hypothetical protein [Paeniglutamicibacter cryotolerans]
MDASAVLLSWRRPDGSPAPAAYPHLAGLLDVGTVDPQTTLAAAKRLDSLVPTLAKHPDAAARIAAVEEEFAAAVATDSPHTAYKVIQNLFDVVDNPHLPEHGTRTPFTAPPASSYGPAAGSVPRPSFDAGLLDADGIGISAPDWAVEPGTPAAKRPRSTLSDGRGWSDGSDPMLGTPA